MTNITLARMTLFVLGLSICSIAQAALGHREGNSGYGVRVDDEVLAFDIVSYARGGEIHGINPDIEAQLTDGEKDLLTVKLRRLSLDQEVLDILFAKLAELREVFSERNVIFPVAEIIDNFSDFDVYDGSVPACSLAPDFSRPVMQGEDLLQAAVSLDGGIHFCASFFEMPALHKSAIILHEVIYAALEKKAELERLIGFVYSSDLLSDHPLIRSEFSEIVRKLRGQLNSNFNIRNISQVYSVDASVNEPFLQRGVRLCMGKVASDLPTQFPMELAEPDRDSWILWTQAAFRECRDGINFLRYTRRLARREIREGKGYLFNHRSSDGYLPIGAVDTEAEELVDLCSGHSESFCEIAFYEARVFEFRYPPRDLVRVIITSKTVDSHIQGDFAEHGLRLCFGYGSWGFENFRNGPVLWAVPLDLSCTYRIVDPTYSRNIEFVVTPVTKLHSVELDEIDGEDESYDLMWRWNKKAGRVNANGDNLDTLCEDGSCEIVFDDDGDFHLRFP